MTEGIVAALTIVMPSSGRSFLLGYPVGTRS
jgi:hypothetical protein